MLESISGLRGIFPDAVNVNYVFKSVCKFCTSIGKSRVAIGMDTRSSSEALALAASSAVKYAGCDATKLGVTTTPELFWYVNREGIDAGVMITASHNPKEWNGVKFVKGGRGLFEGELEHLLASECNMSEPGAEKEGDSRGYYSDIASRIKSKGLKVALDLGGGSATLHVPQLFREAGFKVYAINSSPGIFTRQIDPTQDNLQELSRIISMTGCDVGFAFDCDGDRLQVLDSNGKKLPPDFVVYVVISTLRSGDRVALSVDTSESVINLAKRKGLKVFLSPVGEANVVMTMMKNDCVLGGEGSSAGVIDSRFSYCRDGLLAATLILDVLGREGRLPESEGYHTIRTKMDLPREKAKLVIQAISSKYPEASRIDGVKIRFEEGWALLRLSRTEGYLRVSVEGRNKMQAEYILDRVMNMVKDALRGKG